MQQGSVLETARVPPSLDSPRSAAPETFLLRDAVSAFPIAYGPLLQSLPSAQYRVRAVPVRSPWRSFWNRIHPHIKGGRFAKRETSLSLIQLHARNSQVGQDPVHLQNPQLLCDLRYPR